MPRLFFDVVIGLWDAPISCATKSRDLQLPTTSQANHRMLTVYLAFEHSHQDLSADSAQLTPYSQRSIDLSWVRRGAYGY
jgi:hypothetical protein